MTAASAVERTYEPPCILVEDRCDPVILERIVQELEPYLRRAAACLAVEYPAAVADMVQEARITLWQLDLGRFADGDVEYLRGIVWKRMIDVYRRATRGV